jgi:hypothetical protein
MNPDRKYGQYTSNLSTLLGRAMGVKGKTTYTSFTSIIPAIRTLYAGRYDREEGGNSDMRFEMADDEGKKELLRTLMEEEGILRVDEREKEGGEKEHVLVWLKTVSPCRKSGEYTSLLNTLLGAVVGVRGNIHQSFTSIIPAIRTLYAGRYDREEGGNADMRFEMADDGGKRELLRRLMEEEGVLRVDEREKEGGGGKERVLVWLKMINTQRKHGEYSSALNTLLGSTMGVNGDIMLLSFTSIIPAIRILYAGRYEREEGADADMQFEVADNEGRKDLLRRFMEEEGVLRVEERETEGGKERVLVWLKMINTQRKCGGYTSRLRTLMGQVMGVNGQAKYPTFASIIPVIQTLYEGRYEREEFLMPIQRQYQHSRRTRESHKD